MIGTRANRERRGKRLASSFTLHPSPFRKRGFTLLELLVVLAITAILMVIMFVPLSRAIDMVRRAEAQTKGQDSVRSASRRIARELTQTSSGYEPYTHADPLALQRALRPADVLLVAGNRKLSTAIKYLTQSTWSHAALYIGDALDPPAGGEEPKRLIEVEVGQGCIAVPLSKYATFNTRICRPIGLSEEDAIIRHLLGRPFRPSSGALRIPGPRARMRCAALG